MRVFKNLVLKGGGVRGIAYLGALEVLDKHGILASIERVAGTSVGAISALIISLFPSFKEIKAVADTLEYRKIPSEGLKKEIKEENKKQVKQFLSNIRPLKVNLQSVKRLLLNYGWYSSDYIYHWLRKVIASQFAVKKPLYTFADFINSSIHKDKQKFKELYITGTDVSKRCGRVFSYETTPDMEVAYAIRISMSIPFFFESIPYRYPSDKEDHFWADGGIMWDFPIGIFDTPKYTKKIKHGINKETLGLFLYTSPEKKVYDAINNLIDYVNSVFDSLLLVQEHLYFHEERHRNRVIFIDDLGVSFKNFGISYGDETYWKLYKSGYAAAENFINGLSYFKKRFYRIKKMNNPIINGLAKS